jgi:hypothetical protein
MEKIYILFVILVPLSMFFVGFFVARQFRAMAIIPTFSMMFAQRRLLFSMVMGFFISLMFTVILSISTKFSAQSFMVFIGLFLLATFSYYFGITFGWGKQPSATNENINISSPAQAEPLPENIIVDDFLASVKITINTRKRWVFFAMEAFQWVIMSLCMLPVLSLIAISLLQNYLPQNFRFLVWLLVGGLVLYLLYTKLMEALEFVFDKEVIEIDNLSVRIEKYGLGFSSKKEYLADNIKKITSMFSFGSTNVALKRSPYVNSNMPAFVMWHNRGLKRYRTFGRAVDLADAQRILETIYTKFPQYKG